MFVPLSYHPHVCDFLHNSLPTDVFLTSPTTSQFKFNNKLKNLIKLKIFWLSSIYNKGRKPQEIDYLKLNKELTYTIVL